MAPTRDLNSFFFTKSRVGGSLLPNAGNIKGRREKGKGIDPFFPEESKPANSEQHYPEANKRQVKKLPAETVQGAVKVNGDWGAAGNPASI